MIQSGFWWMFLTLGPVVYWQLPVGLRTAALALMSIALIAVFAVPIFW